MTFRADFLNLLEYRLFDDRGMRIRNDDLALRIVFSLLLVPDTVFAEAGDDLLYFNEDSIYNAELIPLAIGNLASAEFTAGNDNWMIEYEKTDAETEDDEIAETDDNAAEAKTAASVNGEAVDPADVENLWTSVQAIQRTSFASEEIPNGDALLKISITNRNGISAIFAFYACDADSYFAEASDGAVMYVSADAIDRIIRTLRQF